MPSPCLVQILCCYGLSQRFLHQSIALQQASSHVIPNQSATAKAFGMLSPQFAWSAWNSRDWSCV